MNVRFKRDQRIPSARLVPEIDALVGAEGAAAAWSAVGASIESLSRRLSAN